MYDLSDLQKQVTKLLLLHLSVADITQASCEGSVWAHIVKSIISRTHHLHQGEDLNHHKKIISVIQRNMSIQHHWNQWRNTSGNVRDREIQFAHFLKNIRFSASLRAFLSLEQYLQKLVEESASIAYIMRRKENRHNYKDFSAKKPL